MNLVPPTITKISEVDGKTDELEVTWEPYDFDNWAGDSVKYVLYWKKITDDFDEDNINTADYNSHNYTTTFSTVDEVLDAATDTFTHTITGLELFTPYSILLATYNEIGEGSYHKAMNRTGPGSKSLLFDKPTPTFTFFVFLTLLSLSL